MKHLDRSIFLTPHLWSWYRRLFLFQPEACGRSSGLASDFHQGGKECVQKLVGGVMYYNPRKPKYKRGMLMGGSAKD